MTSLVRGTRFIWLMASSMGTLLMCGGVEGHHLAEEALVGQTHRCRAKTRGQQPVECGGVAAALQVPQHQAAGFVAGKAARSPLTHTRRCRRASPPAPPSCPWSAAPRPDGAAPSAATMMANSRPDR